MSYYDQELQDKAVQFANEAIEDFKIYLGDKFNDVWPFIEAAIYNDWPEAFMNLSRKIPLDDFYYYALRYQYESKKNKSVAMSSAEKEALMLFERELEE